MSTETPTIAEPTASEFVSRELAEARVALKNIKLYGTIGVLFLSVYVAVVTAQFAKSMEPENAANIATGLVQAQIDERGDELSASIQEKIPELIRQAPDFAEKQLPTYREKLENKVTGDMSAYVKATTPDLDKRLDDYFASHKDEIKTVLDEGANPDAVHKVGGDIKEQIVDYLKDKPATGPSIQDQIDDSLKSIKVVQQQVDHLANGSQLTPQEKQTRRALAIIAQTVTKENLRPLPIKEGIEAAGTTVASNQ